MWADQICIDQSDPDEKAHQVLIMRHIYECAERAVVWLSGRISAENGPSWIKIQYGMVKRFLDHRRNETVLNAIQSVTEAVAEEHVKRGLDNVLFQIGLTGLNKLANSAWWTRCWVV
jgi:hypothetical protein